MLLKEQLEETTKEFSASMPEQVKLFAADTALMVDRGVGTGGPAVGDTAPDFELPDQLGRTVKSADFRAQEPLVISFYRGGWCPYCNLELRALQQHLPQFTALGASLVAISPQLPDESMTTVEKNELSFPVLSDVGNQVARQFGLVFSLSESLRPIYADFGIDLPKYNGTDTFELPVPATFVIDSAGTVKAAYVNADYKQRMEPAEIVEVLTKMK